MAAFSPWLSSKLLGNQKCVKQAGHALIGLIYVAVDVIIFGKMYLFSCFTPASITEVGSLFTDV